MSNVFWRRCRPDPEGVVWTDLRDPKSKDWVIAYREYHGTWHVMWNSLSRLGNPPDQLINQATTSEEKLRNDLMLDYILTRGEPNKC